MAEALAIVGLVSAIVQFVDFGGKVLERLNEFNSDLHEVPKTFQAISTQLPLLIDTLQRINQRVTGGHVSDATATALKSLVDACSAEIQVLQKILDNTLPDQNSSSWQRRLLALKSLRHNKDVDRSVTKLEGYIRLLTFSQSTSSLDSIDTLLKLEALRLSQNATSHQPCKPVFMIPFDRNDAFVGRLTILNLVHQKLTTSHRRAVLTGLGGVG
jgi:hypothetical protein